MSLARAGCKATLHFIRQSGQVSSLELLIIVKVSGPWGGSHCLGMSAQLDQRSGWPFPVEFSLARLALTNLEADLL